MPGSAPRATRYRKFVPVRIVQHPRTTASGRRSVLYEARWSIGGHRHGQGLGSKAREARRRAADLEREVNYGHLSNDPALEPVTLGDACQAWVDRKRAMQQSKFTIQVDGGMARRVAAALGPQRLVQDVSFEDIALFLTALQATHSNDTVNNYRRVIAKWFKWLIRRGQRTGANPVGDFAPLPTNRDTGTARKKFLEDAELAAILKAAETDRDPRALPTVMLFACTGLRRSEVCFLRLDDLHLEDAADPFLVILPIRERRLKTPSRRTRDVPIVPQLLPHVKRLADLSDAYRHPAMETLWLYPGQYSATHADRPLSPNWFSQMFCRLGRAAGVERCGPHMFRHTLQTKLGLSGVAQEVAMQLADHSSRTVNDLYRNHRTPPTPRSLVRTMIASVDLVPPTTP